MQKGNPVVVLFINLKHIFISLITLTFMLILLNLLFRGKLGKLSKYVDANQAVLSDNHIFSAFRQAVRSGNIEVVKYFLIDKFGKMK